MISFFTDPKEPSPIPLAVIEAVNDQDDSNQGGDGVAEQADNGGAEQVQVENGDGMANVDILQCLLVLQNKLNFYFFPPFFNDFIAQN